MTTTINRPKAGTATGKVWEIADSLVRQGDHGAIIPTRQTVLSCCIRQGIMKGTAQVQYGNWVKAYRQANGLESAVSDVNEPGVTYHRPEVIRPVSNLQRAIDDVEGRGFEVTYIGNGMYRVEPARGGQWPSYYSKDEIGALAEMPKNEMREMIRAEQHPNKYMVAAQPVEAVEDEGLITTQPFSRDELLMATDDVLRERESNPALDLSSWVSDNITGIAQYNMGRFVSALQHAVTRRVAQQA
jgi:hypothetical protein